MTLCPVYNIILWCVKLCHCSSTVFTHSNSCFDRYVWFKVHAVGMSLTWGETQHWLAVAAQRHAMSPEKFNFFNFKQWGDGRFVAWFTSRVSPEVTLQLIASLHWFCVYSCGVHCFWSDHTLRREFCKPNQIRGARDQTTNHLTGRQLALPTEPQLPYVTATL